jgi:hypothetical protein
MNHPFFTQIPERDMTRAFENMLQKTNKAYSAKMGKNIPPKTIIPLPSACLAGT